MQTIRSVLRLNEKYGIRITLAKQTIRSVGADEEIAGKLAVPYGVPLFKVERVGYSSEMIPIEFLRIYYRGDRYVLYNELHL